MEPARPVCLVGPRCVGKTTLGPRLAGALGRTFVDLDAALAAACAARGPSAPALPEGAGALLRRLGPVAFRELEAATLERVLGSGAGVVALGAGAVERAASREVLRRRARCVWLWAEPALLRERLRADPTDRPPLEGADAAQELERVGRRREPLYAAVAHHVVVADAPPEVVLERVLAALASAPRTPREPE